MKRDIPTRSIIVRVGGPSKRGGQIRKPGNVPAVVDQSLSASTTA
jgi:hypothetical protein